MKRKKAFSTRSIRGINIISVSYTHLGRILHITQKWWRWALGMAALVLLFVCLIINPLWLWQTQAADGDFQSNVESIYYSPMITDTIEIKQSFRPIVSYLEEISVYFYPCGEKHGNLTVTLEKEAAIDVYKRQPSYR